MSRLYDARESITGRGGGCAVIIVSQEKKI